MSKNNSAEKVFEIDTHIIKQYDVVKRLGKGAYGIVWKAVDKKTQKTVAVKKIFDAFRNQTDAQRTFREIMFLLSFSNHENIIRLKGLHKANNDRDIYLVFEFMVSDLHNVIKKGNILKNIHKVYIMYQLFKAIKYIHSGNVIHRDLKPSNILLNCQCHCKIADFGLARSVTQIGEGDGEVGSNPALTDYVATRWYRAPEILIASKRYTKGIDMWSLGCIFGEMLLGKPLFPGTSTINQIERIMLVLPTPTQEDIISVGAGYGSSLLEQKSTAPHRSLEELLPNISDEALHLLENLIVFNPNCRLTAVEALEHPYVANFHKRSNEPERGSKVTPWLNDDIQLSVDEYRNKLYSMMDNKNKTQKHMSKSRIRRLSDNLKKEHVEQITNATSNLIAKKTFHASCDDLRKDKSKFDVKESVAKEKLGKSTHDHYTGKMCGDVKTPLPPPLQSKSCIYYSQQKSTSKVQRSIQPDQVNINGHRTKLKPSITQPKPRHISTSLIYESTATPYVSKNSNTNYIYNSIKQPNHEAMKLPKRSFSKVANVTKHFVHNSDKSLKNTSHNNIIQNYLNESVISNPSESYCTCDAKESAPTKINQSKWKQIKRNESEMQIPKRKNSCLKNTVWKEEWKDEAKTFKRVNKKIQCKYPEKSAITVNDYKYNFNTIDAKNYGRLLNNVMEWTIK